MLGLMNSAEAYKAAKSFNEALGLGAVSPSDADAEEYLPCALGCSIVPPQRG